MTKEMRNVTTETTEVVTVDVTEFVTVVAVAYPNPNVTTETTEVVTVDVSSSGSEADNMTEFVTADPNVTTETTEVVTVDVSSGGSASAIIKRKTSVMTAREMMKYFQKNQKAVTSVNQRKKSVNESPQGTSARGLNKEDQAPRIKTPASRKKKKNTNINAKRVQGGSNWGFENGKLTSSSSSSNEGSSEGSSR